VQTIGARGKERSATRWSRTKALVPSERRPFVYGALVVFSFLYYYRPEDFIGLLAYIPMARIAGVLGLVALIAGMAGTRSKIPTAVKMLWLLLLQMTLCIPTALWRGGAFSTVFEKFAKGVIVAMLISMSVVAVRELRKLLWLQVSAVALVVFFSIAFRHFRDGRLQGIQKGILENPNDLAINIAISFPLGLAFMLHARGLKKVVWAVALAVMCLGLVLTYSRSGLLAFILAIMVCVWEYGIKGKRRSLVITTVVIMVLGMCAALSTAHYRARVESIVMGNVEGSGDKGSLEARKALGDITSPAVWGGPRMFRNGGQGLGGGSQQLHRIVLGIRNPGSCIVSAGDGRRIQEHCVRAQVAKVPRRPGVEAFHAGTVGGPGGVYGGGMFCFH
jgi:hypothetical protein